MLESLQSDPNGGTKHSRIFVGSENFTPGSTANEVCESIHKQYSSTQYNGIWLLQVREENFL